MHRRSCEIYHNLSLLSASSQGGLFGRASPPLYEIVIGDACRVKKFAAIRLVGILSTPMDSPMFMPQTYGRSQTA
jgi:hypothetical protein